MIPTHCQPVRPRAPRGSTGRPTLRFALGCVALGCAVIGCAASAPAPETKAKPSPVYAWTRAANDPNTASEAPPASTTTHWRFVPLSLAPKPFPAAHEFVELAKRCEEAARASETDGALVTCLADRGFYLAQCSDGLDNDGDTLSDFGEDPGCAEPHALSESPECDDDRDNDGDGLVDWDGGGFTHPDPQCVDLPAGNREAEPRKRRSLNPF